MVTEQKITHRFNLSPLFQRDRILLIAALVGMTGLSWFYLVLRSQSMAEMSVVLGEALRLKPWTFIEFVLMVLMWSIMMVGMMIPSAIPMIFLYAKVRHSVPGQGSFVVAISFFVLGYLIIWLGFSFAATVVQWRLEQAALLSPMMVSTSPMFGGILLIAAGAYQWSSLKSSCLVHCSAPVQFISSHWRKGTLGALGMGLEHGLYCLGCCWVLMCLLFVGGVMNLLWIASIAGFVLLEKVMLGIKGARFAGIALAAMGIFVILL